MELDTWTLQRSQLQGHQALSSQSSHCGAKSHGSSRQVCSFQLASHQPSPLSPNMNAQDLSPSVCAVLSVYTRHRMTLGSPFTCLGCFPCYKVKSDENGPAGLDRGGGSPAYLAWCLQVTIAQEGLLSPGWVQPHTRHQPGSLGRVGWRLCFRWRRQICPFLSSLSPLLPLPNPTAHCVPQPEGEGYRARSLNLGLGFLGPGPHQSLEPHGWTYWHSVSSLPHGPDPLPLVMAGLGVVQFHWIYSLSFSFILIPPGHTRATGVMCLDSHPHSELGAATAVGCHHRLCFSCYLSPTLFLLYQTHHTHTCTCTHTHTVHTQRCTCAHCMCMGHT
jgi:hypothetical protein